ncbi:hypothetical protein [Streptomyces sp. NPDC005181]
MTFYNRNQVKRIWHKMQNSRGREMAEHPELAADLDLKFYFCEPSSP